MPNPLEDLLSQLQAEAGPRGSTFAGRLVPKGSKQSIGDVMSKPPIGELETAGNIDLDAIRSLGTLFAGIPLLSKMKLPEGSDLNKIFEHMYQLSKERHSQNTNRENILSRDAFTESQLSNLGQSTIGRWLGRTNKMPHVDMVTNEYGTNVPRSHQLAATANVADKIGALDNPEILRKIIENIYRRNTHGVEPSRIVGGIRPEMLDWYKQFLEGVKPD